MFVCTCPDACVSVIVTSWTFVSDGALTWTHVVVVASDKEYNSFRLCSGNPILNSTSSLLSRTMACSCLGCTFSEIHDTAEIGSCQMLRSNVDGIYQIR